MSGLGRWAGAGWQSFRSFDRSLYRAADRLTPGQQWTAGLCLVFGACLVLFGLPPKTIVTPGPTAAGAATAPAASIGGTSSPASAVGTVGASDLGGVSGISSSGGASGGAGAAGGGYQAGGVPPAAGKITGAATGLGSLAVLTAGNPSGLPGRDDASIAAAFFGPAQFPWKQLDVSGDPAAACAAAVAVGQVAVASHDLPPALRDCLLGHGTTVLAFDQSGGRAGSGGGALVSTRRGDTATLVDLARWGVASRSLTGRVGLVGDAARRADIIPALSGMRGAGVHVVATAWVGGSTSAADQVTAFERAGVEQVVFAAPVQTQDTWLGQAASQGALFHYVVSDVDDGVVNESYPPTFDGTLAHTSLRIPWYARSHGATARQQQCTGQWTAAATPAVLLPSETAPVYAWCEEAAVLSAVYASAPSSVSRLAAVISQLRVDSPLTANLGPLAGGGWGPTQDAVLVWRAACECWQEAQPFRSRTASPDR